MNGDRFAEKVQKITSDEENSELNSFDVKGLIMQT